MVRRQGSERSGVILRKHPHVCGAGSPECLPQHRRPLASRPTGLPGTLNDILVKIKAASAYLMTIEAESIGSIKFSAMFLKHIPALVGIWWTGLT
jgi:hypothetical protein